MKDDLKTYVELCPICQRGKSKAVSLGGLLQPLAALDRI